MRTDEVKIGDLVAVNDSPVGTVYRIAQKQGHLVKLVYAAGTQLLEGGTMDTCYLRAPSETQLQNALKSAMEALS